MHSKHGELAGGSDCQAQNLAWTTSRIEREALLTASVDPWRTGLRRSHIKARAG